MTLAQLFAAIGAVAVILAGACALHLAVTRREVSRLRHRVGWLEAHVATLTREPLMPAIRADGECERCGAEITPDDYAWECLTGHRVHLRCLVTDVDYPRCPVCLEAAARTGGRR